MGSASEGDFVTPGTTLSLDDAAAVGSGIARIGDSWVAVRSGHFVTGDTADVTSSGSTPRRPEQGEIVIGEVRRVHPKTAEITILHIEGRQDGERTMPALSMAADMFVSEIVDRFLPSPGDGLQARDIVRARIIQTDPMLKASCKGDSALGVLHALCPTCGQTLVPSDSTPDENVICNRCDYTGFRALSDGYGHGHLIPEGASFSELNRNGERWTPEMEARLGHDGARPYLSPLADYRRGSEHSIPKEALRRGGDGRGSGGRGGRPRRQMHSTKCTLCGTDCSVPFQPTPGKPVRCSPCKDKVDAGEADAESLATEREALTKARDAARESDGMKLFVGSMPFDATEDELRSLCEPHGEVKSCDIAVDKDGKPRGYAFVVYASRKEGAAALKALKGSELHGRRLRFDESTSGGGGGRGKRSGNRGGRGGRNNRDRGGRGSHDRRRD